MSRPHPLRVGIVGSGFMATVHARAAARAGASIVAVVTRSGQADIAAALGADRAVTSLDELADVVDVVHVCTPNARHEEHVRQVLALGSHVICEKPLATSPGSATGLAAAAAAAGVVATVPFIYRYYGAVREMRHRIAAQPHLIHLRGSYLQDWLADPRSTNWRVDPGEAGASRAFGDIGVHWVDLAEFVTGKRITRIVAQMKTVVPARPGIDGSIQTEDLAGLLFETEHGVSGQVAVSQVSWGRTNRLHIEVDGRDAAWAFDSEREEQLWSASSDGVRLHARGRSASPDVTRLDRVPAGHPQGYQDCFDAFVADTYTAIATDRLPDGLPTFADGARAAAVTHSVLASAHTGTWCDVEPLSAS